MRTLTLAILAAAVIPNCAFARPTTTGEPFTGPTRLVCKFFVSNKTTGAGAEEQKESSLVLTERGLFATNRLSAEGLLLQGGAHVSLHPARAPSITLSISHESSMKHIAYSLSDGWKSSVTAENDSHKAHISCQLAE